MSDEKLTPERVVRLLRAKGGELEHGVMRADHFQYSAYDAAADIALIAQLLADHIERSEVAAHGPFVTKTGKVLTDEDIERLADEEYRSWQRANEAPTVYSTQPARTVDVPGSFPVGTEVTWTEKHPDDFGLEGREEKREPR